MIENATAQSGAQALQDWTKQLVENPELYRIYREGLIDDSSLTKEERGRFDLVLLQAFYSIASIYLQYRNGGLSDERWDSEYRVFGVNVDTKGGRASWERQKHMLNPVFQSEIEKRLANGKLENWGDT